MYLVYFYHQCRHLALQSHTLFIADSYPGLTFSLQSLTQALPFSLQTLTQAGLPFSLQSLTQAFPFHCRLIPRPYPFHCRLIPRPSLLITVSYPGLPFLLQSHTQAFDSCRSFNLHFSFSSCHKSSVSSTIKNGRLATDLLDSP